MIDIAFKRLFPDKKYIAYWGSVENAYGYTIFNGDELAKVVIDCGLSVENAAEIFAHELAHVGVGEDEQHNEVWEKAFDDLNKEFDKVKNELIREGDYE